MCLHKFRARRGWLLGGALVVALLVSACGLRSSSPPPATSSPSGGVPTAAVSAEPVRRGNIQQTFAYSGDIRSREQVSVLPKASGRIVRLPVDIGSQVKAGDTIANLDQENAQIQVLQVRAALAGAAARLASIEAGSRGDEIAGAEAALIQQQVRLEDMQAGGRAEDIQLAQAALDAQQAKLELMVQGGRVEAIQAARDGLDGATVKLKAVEIGATDDIRQAAQTIHRTAARSRITAPPAARQKPRPTRRCKPRTQQ